MARTVAFVLFEGAEELDFAGPWEVFTMVNAVAPDSVECYITSEKGGTITCAKGMRVLADYAFADAPKADIVLIPGGFATRTEENNPVLLDFLRKMNAGSELTTSVCSGALVLEKAGLLEGKKATTHWIAIDDLKSRPGVEVLTQTRFVEDGKVITSAGVSAGIDMALHAVGRLWGPKVAAATQHAMEYYPDPPKWE